MEPQGRKGARLGYYYYFLLLVLVSCGLVSGLLDAGQPQQAPHGAAAAGAGGGNGGARLRSNTPKLATAGDQTHPNELTQESQVHYRSGPPSTAHSGMLCTSAEEGAAAAAGDASRDDVPGHTGTSMQHDDMRNSNTATQRDHGGPMVHDTQSQTGPSHAQASSAELWVPAAAGVLSSPGTAATAHSDDHNFDHGPAPRHPWHHGALSSSHHDGDLNNIDVAGSITGHDGNGGRSTGRSLLQAGPLMTIYATSVDSYTFPITPTTCTGCSGPNDLLGAPDSGGW